MVSGKTLAPLIRYWHTLRHLKPVQVYGRVWFRLARPPVDSRPAPVMRERQGAWALPARRAPSLLGGGRLCFLNEIRELAAHGWDDPALTRLWRYNLHYFDDLNAVGAKARAADQRALLSKWVRENRPASGTGWEPYPCSLRIVNWIKWGLAGNALAAESVQSLAVQTRWLVRRLEEHLLGNHLFANAKALVFAGLFFEGAEAERWFEKGMSVLAREIPEQFLADGGQFERSPMYHALALEDVLDLINVAGALPDGVPEKWRAFVDSWPALAQRMRTWLAAMCHPDGEISFFNDAAMGIAPSPAEFERYASDLVGTQESIAAAAGSLRVRHLAQSGYVRAEAPDTVLLLDVAPVGPDYLPAHAHADTLSFELSLFGQRVIVNGGTSRYGLGPGRETERGTPAHSTVTVDGENSSEVWAGFRVARRARPFDLAVSQEGSFLRVSCAHDGYRRLAGRPVHRRAWVLEPGVLRVEDRIEGSFGTAVARFHLHPAVDHSLDESGASGRLRMPGGQPVHWRASGGSVRIEPSSYCPEFGRRDATRCLAVEFEGASPVSLELTW